MKKIKIIFMLIIVSVFSYSCVVGDDSDNPFETPPGYGIYPIYTPSDIEFEAASNPADSQVSFSIGASESGGAQASSGEVLVSYSNSAFAKLADIASFPSDMSISLADIATALGLDASTLSTNGGIVDFKTNFTSVNGEFMTSTSFLKAIILCPPTPGDYTIEMEDSFGDGWQTTDGSAGDGITITLNTGEVIEVGMCSPYASSAFTCSPGTSSASATVTIPNGTLTSDWYFPGDWYEEISFSIYSPAGNLIASFGTGTPAGPLLLNLCGD